jgi:hypothetical protein
MKIEEPKTPFGVYDSDDETDARKEEILQHCVYCIILQLHGYYSSFGFGSGSDPNLQGLGSGSARIVSKLLDPVHSS